MKCAIQLKLEKLDPSLWPHFSRIATFWDLTVNDLRLLGLRDALIGHWICIVGIIYNLYTPMVYECPNESLESVASQNDFPPFPRQVLTILGGCGAGKVGDLRVAQRRVGDEGGGQLRGAHGGGGGEIGGGGRGDGSHGGGGGEDGGGGKASSLRGVHGGGGGEEGGGGDLEGGGEEGGGGGGEEGGDGGGKWVEELVAGEVEMMAGVAGLLLLLPLVALAFGQGQIDAHITSFSARLILVGGLGSSVGECLYVSSCFFLSFPLSSPLSSPLLAS